MRYKKNDIVKIKKKYSDKGGENVKFVVKEVKYSLFKR